MLAAGTVPFLSFVVEHWVTKNDREYQARKAVLGGVLRAPGVEASTRCSYHSR